MRLTKRDEYGNADIIGVDSADLQLNLEFNGLNLVTAALNKLAAYEDAEAEGRLVVLPCKVGDTVYFIREEYTGNNSIQSNEVFEIKLDSRGVVFYGVPRRCSMDFMYYIEDLGKTVFLTRAEAEAALVKEVDRERD